MCSSVAGPGHKASIWSPRELTQVWNAHDSGKYYTGLELKATRVSNRYLKAFVQMTAWSKSSVTMVIGTREADKSIEIFR